MRTTHCSPRSLSRWWREIVCRKTLLPLESRGLAFKPTAEYETLLTQAGGTVEVAKAVSNGTVRDVAAAQNVKQDLLTGQHLALAGKLIREKKYEQADQELTSLLQAGDAKLEAQFVMGEELRQQGQWAMAAAVYSEIVKHDESFREAQTKLSFVPYHLGDSQGSLEAARAALAATPNNAEAHENAGLTLGTMEKFDAAREEYREALGIKPDYETVHFDLGMLLTQMNDIDGSISEYEYALKMNPNDVDARINLALNDA